MTKRRLCETCRARAGVSRVRDDNEKSYMLADGTVLALADGKYLGLARGSEYLGTHWERVTLTRVAPHLCQACRPKVKGAVRKRKAVERAGQGKLFG